VAPTNPDRTRARLLADGAAASGDALGWFERLYAEAESGDAVVPWADLEPNPFLVAALDERGLPPGRALVVGCGYGDDAAHLAGLGWTVAAFDVSPTSVAKAKERWASLGDAVQWETCDVLKPFRGWLSAFDLVVEVYTVQVLPPGSPERMGAPAEIGGCVKPGGRLVVVARARPDGEPLGAFPWPLDRAELDSFAAEGTLLVEESVVQRTDPSEDPPVARWVAWFSRPA
jgi:SAM-dependent methyltransferase